MFSDNLKLTKKIDSLSTINSKKAVFLLVNRVNQIANDKEKMHVNSAFHERAIIVIFKRMF